MTNIDAIDAIEQWLIDAGITTGYTVKAIFHSGDSLVNDIPLLFIRKSGNGSLNSNLKEVDYMIAIYNNSESIVDMSNAMSAIEALAQSTTYPAGVSKCRLLVSAVDPYEIDSGIFESFLQIRLTVEL